MTGLTARSREVHKNFHGMETRQHEKYKIIRSFSKRYSVCNSKYAKVMKQRLQKAEKSIEKSFVVTNKLGLDKVLLLT